ncbi:MAG: thiamine-phosphate pyrophosphorylase [Subtercola sp.]|nr:thiamine-phosphate pyrophosphorylase [Subtercola sp.]
MTVEVNTRTSFDPRVYFVTDEQLCGPRGVLETTRRVVAGGATAVQLRAKDAPAAHTFELLLRLAEVCSGRATLIVNDRVDVFLAARAAGAEVGGVHVGQDDLPIALVRELVGPQAVVGLTANTPAHLAAATALPPGTVDYLGVGVIRPTSTKADHPEALGTTGFADFAAMSVLPCVAIGGIRLEDVAALRRAGGTGVAVVSALCAAPDPERAARAFREEWDRAGS